MVSSLIPLAVSIYQKNKVTAKQMQIIDKYEESDEYFNNVESALNKNDLDFRNGDISREEYAKNLDYIVSQDFSKNSLLEGDMIEYKNQYISLQNKQDKTTDICFPMSLTLVGIGGAIGLSSIVADSVLLIKNKDIIDEERKRKQKQEIPQCMKIQEEKE